MKFESRLFAEERHKREEKMRNWNSHTFSLYLSLSLSFLLAHLDPHTKIACVLVGRCGCVERVSETERKRSGQYKMRLWGRDGKIFWSSWIWIFSSLSLLFAFCHTIAHTEKKSSVWLGQWLVLSVCTAIRKVSVSELGMNIIGLVSLFCIT